MLQPLLSVSLCVTLEGQQAEVSIVIHITVCSVKASKKPRKTVKQDKLSEHQPLIICSDSMSKVL